MTKNMFVSCSQPRFDCKLIASLFDLYGPSFVFYIIQVCLYGPIVV